MKLSFVHLPFLAVFAFVLPSCVDLDTGGYGGGYDGGYSGGYSGSYYRPNYYNSGYGYRDYNDRNRYYYNDRDRDRDRDDDKKIKLIGGNDGRHPNRPEGYHTEEWYRDNGYKLSKYNYKDEHGTVKKNVPTNHKDDDKKHKH